MPQVAWNTICITAFHRCSDAPSEDLGQDDLFDWDPKAGREATEASEEACKKRRNPKTEAKQRSRKRKAEGGTSPADCMELAVLLPAAWALLSYLCTRKALM